MMAPASPILPAVRASVRAATASASPPVLAAWTSDAAAMSASPRASAVLIRSSDGLDCIPANQCCNFVTPNCGPYGEPVCKQGAGGTYGNAPAPNCPEGWPLCPGEPRCMGGAATRTAYYVNGDGHAFCQMTGFTPCNP